MKKRWGALLAGLVVFAAWGASSCSPAAFQSETVIDTVRILASRASEPRAKPGDTVTLDLLAYDGRPTPATKMNLFWLPLPCLNPANDAYYACFAELASGTVPRGAVVDASVSDGGTAGDAGQPEEGGTSDAGLPGLTLRPGVDLTPVLVSGPTFDFTVPSNAVIPRKGASPYGLVILFNFACAGHLEILPFDPNSPNPQQIPIGCFDAHDNQLGADDFVFGFTRVYVEDAPIEVNPVITQVDTAAGRLDIDGGVATGSFMATQCAGDADTCQHLGIGPIVPPSAPTSKQVWADFYATAGTFTSSARLLYDPMTTLSIPSGTNDAYISPNDLSGIPAQNFIWIVVHDDQGGADWVTVPLALR